VTTTSASLKQLLDGIRTADGLFTVDAGQRITYMNPTAGRILGCSAAEMVGKHCFEVVAGRDASNAPFCRRDCPIIVRAQSGETTPAYDVAVADDDGGPCWVNTSILLLDSPEDGSTVVAHVIRNVTSERHMHLAAREAAQALRGPTDVDTDAPPPQDPPRPRLSRRELEVLRLLTQGMSNNRIAEALYISPITARNHVDRIIVKLGVESRLQAVLYASRHHLI